MPGTVVLRFLDELGFPGYGISVDGEVWSRLDTHSQFTDQWVQRETRFKSGAVYVRLQKDRGTVEVRVARLMIESAFGRLPGHKGFRIRHRNGDPRDCRLVNLTYAPKRGFSFLAMDGAKFKDWPPKGFVPVQV